MHDVLTDIEKEAIATFLSNEVMSEAVRKVLLAGIYYNGTLEPGKPADPSKNFMLQVPFMIEMQNLPITDEELGQQTRANAKAIIKVEQAWKELKNCVPTPPVADKNAKPHKAK